MLPKPRQKSLFELVEEGGDHALQDDDAGADPAAPPDVRTAAETAESSADAGSLLTGTEVHSRPLERTAGADEAGEQSHADSERSLGNGPPRSRGLFADRVFPERRRAAFDRRRASQSPQSFTARVRPSSRSLFDNLGEASGTVISPLAGSSCASVPPEGFRQRSLDPDASLRLDADSLSCQATQGDFNMQQLALALP